MDATRAATEVEVDGTLASSSESLPYPASDAKPDMPLLLLLPSLLG